MFKEKLITAAWVDENKEGVAELALEESDGAYGLKLGI